MLKESELQEAPRICIANGRIFNMRIKIQIEIKSEFCKVKFIIFGVSELNERVALY